MINTEMSVILLPCTTSKLNVNLSMKSNIIRQTQNSDVPPPAKRPRINNTNFNLTVPDSDEDDNFVTSSNTVLDQVLNEIKEYARTKLDLADTLNPIYFWRENRFKYPQLAIISRMLLSIPASSVPSECLFSKAGDIVTDNRNRLKPQLVEMLLFVKENHLYA